MGVKSGFYFEEPGATAELIDQIRDLSQSLQSPEDLGPLMARLDGTHYALLGEASHGTAEYYSWRAEISRRLIVEQDFRFIAVEGDWSDCFKINRYVKGDDSFGSDARAVLGGFQRWPTWMWANEEMIDLLDWLRRYNAARSPETRIGFYGLDIYDLWDSLQSVLGYLRRFQPDAVDTALRALRCFEAYGEDPRAYASAMRFAPASCEEEVITLLQSLSQARAPAPSMPDDDEETLFHALQSAYVVKNAESYYRTMIRGGYAAWNTRDQHMADTLERLVDFHDGGKAIVWAHNTHIGDARFTDMAESGMINIGQIVRERHPRAEVALVGFASYRGSVIAGREWEAPFERMVVPPARHGSWEALLHAAAAEDQLLIFDDDLDREALLQPRGHRAIGVVYHPEMEQYGNYMPSVLPRRYDALIFLHETSALHPLPLVVDTERLPDTFPSAH